MWVKCDEVNLHCHKSRALFTCGTKKDLDHEYKSHVPDLSFLIQALPISRYPNNLIGAFLQFVFIQIQPKSKAFRII